MANEQIYEVYASGTTNPNFSARRNELLLGPLPNDFLRVPGQNQRPTDGGTSDRSPHQPAGYPPGAAMYPGPVGVPYAVPGGYAPPPRMRMGFLDVTMVEAVLNKNYGITKMDPYCRVRVGHNIIETDSHMGGGKRPQWNKILHFPLEPGVDSVHVEIYDERVFNADSCIARCVVQVPQEVMEGQSLTDTYPLSGKLGENLEGHVKMVMSYSVRDMPPYMSYGMPGMVQPSYTMVYPGTYMMPYGVPSYTYPHGGVPMHAPSSHPVVVKDADIAALQEMFPEKSCEQIKAALERCRGHKETAINELLQ